MENDPNRFSGLSCHFPVLACLSCSQLTRLGQLTTQQTRRSKLEALV